MYGSICLYFRHIWETSIEEDLKELGCEVVDLIHLVQDWD
jgi:hypothetical protein